jgi:hypothetical protein
LSHGAREVLTGVPALDVPMVTEFLRVATQQLYHSTGVGIAIRVREICKSRDGHFCFKSDVNKTVR